MDDPDAPRRVAAIVDDPTYAPAERDTGFLEHDDTRGVRLQMDYLKAELQLRKHDIAHTIVVFGSTRIVEPAAALRQVETDRDAVARAPDDRDALRRLARSERILVDSRYYEIARELGRRVGAAGERASGGRIVVATGGGPGLMEAANRGAFDVGARSIGLNITLPDVQFPNPYVTPGLCFQFHYFAIRKLHFLLRARALVAFPGGFGTFDELFETLTLIQTGKIAPIPVILVGESYWRRAIDLEFLVEEGVIDPEDQALFWFAETAADVWNGIVDWYRAAGRPLVPAE